MAMIWTENTITTPVDTGWRKFTKDKKFCIVNMKNITHITEGVSSGSYIYCTNDRILIVDESLEEVEKILGINQN